MSSAVWKEKLYELRYQSIHTLESGDSSFFTALQVHAFQQPPDSSTGLYSARADPNVKEIEDLIRDKTADACTRADSNYKSFSGKVEDLKNEPKELPAWQAQLENMREEAKETSNQIIDDTFDSILGLIDSAPSSLQSPLANMFVGVWGKFMDFLNTIAKWLKNLVDAVVDFFKGIWTKIKEGLDAVKNGFNTAIKFIKGLFTFSNVRLPTVITLPRGSGTAKVFPDVAKINNYLMEHNVQLVKQTVEVSHDSDSITVSTTLSRNDTQKGDQSLENVWTQALRNSSLHWETRPVPVK